MPGRNLAKPFSIAGFILAEIYMLFTVLAPYSHQTQPLPMPPLAEAPVAARTPAPLSAQLTRVVVCAVFFGPFGALVGMGAGLVVSGFLGDFRTKPNSPSGAPPGGGDAPPPRRDGESRTG